MRKLLFFALTLLGITLQGMAQEIKVPKWDSFAKPNKEGVFLRKAPNAQSQRLMYKGGSYHADPISYSWTGGTGYKPLSLSKETLLPIIKTVGNWYLLYFNENIEAYVHKDQCDSYEPYGFDGVDEMLEVNGVDLTKVKGDKNLFVTCYDDLGNWSDQFTYFGKKFGTGIVWADYGEDGLAFAREECKAKESFGWFKGNLINENHVEQFINSHRPAKGWNMISYRFDWQHAETYKFNPATYQHEMISQPEVIKIHKFIVPKDGDGLQMVEAPKADAAKLVSYHTREMGIDYAVEFYRNTMKRENVYPFTFNYLAVIEDLNDWYKVLYCAEGYPMFPIEGYVAKTDCKDAVIGPLTRGGVKSNIDSAQLFSFNGRDYLFYWSDDRVTIYMIIDNITKRECSLKCEANKNSRTVIYNHGGV